MKIIHLISSLSRGGRERQLATIVANTDLEQYPTKIVYFNERKSTYVDEYDLKKHSIKIQSKSFWSRLMELKNTIKREKPDVVYTWANLESVFILLLNPFYRFKFVNGSVRHGIRSKKFSHYFRTFILHLSTFIVANSYAGLKANNIKRGMVLYNGIAPKFIGKFYNKEKMTRRESILPEATGKLLFISVANLVPYKDYFSVLKALKELKEENIDFHYLILGDGPLRNSIKNTIEQYSLQDNVTLLGNVENVADYLKISDIFIHSSKGEGCSNAILEAMAAGLPIVASNTGGTSEIVNDNNGLLFEYKDYGQLKNVLMEFVSKEHKRIEAGDYSLRIIQDKFTIERMMDNYYSLLNEIAKQ